MKKIGVKQLSNKRNDKRQANLKPRWRPGESGNYRGRPPICWGSLPVRALVNHAAAWINLNKPEDFSKAVKFLLPGLERTS